MDDNILSKALSDALIDEYIGSVPEIVQPHEFSEKFEKKMKKLISRREKPYYKIINTAGKRAACVAVIIAVATAAIFSVEAIRVAFLDFVTNIFEKFSVVEPVNVDETPLVIEDIYVITYGLSGYSVIKEINSELINCISYSNGDETIDYFQYVKHKFSNILWNTEDTLVNEIYINGKQAIYYIDNNDFKTIIWDNGDYIFVICANIDSEMLINIAESVKKVNK